MAISPDQFGAVGDGVTNDRDAVLLAISAAHLCRDFCGLILGACSPECRCPHHASDVGPVDPAED